MTFDSRIIAGRVIRSTVPARHRDQPATDGPAQWCGTRDRLIGLAGTGYLVALVGPRGTGKTQIAAEAVRKAAELCTDHTEPVYRTAFRLFQELRDAMRPGATESESRLCRKLEAASLLVIDEAHERGQTPYEDRVLTAIVDARYGARRDTLLIANATPAEFQAQIGPSVASRLIECGGIVECDWPSFRTGATP